MAFGPFAGGRIFDAFNSDIWLYIGAATVPLAAIAGLGLYGAARLEA